MSIIPQFVDEMDDLDKNGRIIVKIEHTYLVTTSIFAYGFQQIKSGMSFLIFKI